MKAKQLIYTAVLRAVPAATTGIILMGWAFSAGASEDGYSSWWLPPNISGGYGLMLDRVFIIIGWITIVGAVGVLSVLAFALVKYRYRPNRKAAYFPGHRRIEVSMLVLVTVLVIGGEFFVMGQITGGIWDDIKRDVPAGAMEIDVLAEQFAWNVRYPGADGVFGRTDIELIDTDNPFGLDEDDAAAEDDIVTDTVHVPVGRPVVVRLRSKDVLHSFFIPVLRIKQDAVPGETINVWFQADRPGDFQVVCAELCGLGHTTMSTPFIAHNIEDFQAWLEEEAANR